MQDWFNALMKVDTPRGQFHRAINERSAERKKSFLKVQYYSPDPSAMVVALDYSVVTESTKKHCLVDLASPLTRGQMIVDWNGASKKEPNVEIIKRVDIEKVKKYYERMVQ